MKKININFCNFTHKILKKFSSLESNRVSLSEYRLNIRKNLVKNSGSENKFKEISNDDNILSGETKEHLVLPKDNILSNFRAKGIFERDPDDKSTPKIDYLYGIKPVISALGSYIRKISALYVLEEYKKNPPSHIKEIIKNAASKNIRIEFHEKENMDSFTANRDHNGILLKVEQREFIHMKENKKFFESLKKPAGNIIVLLDKIIDPQNFGSIVRTCFYYGIDYLIVNKLNRPAISPAVSQVSLGTSELMSLHCVKSFNTFVMDASQRGWQIITTTTRVNKNADKTKTISELKINSNSNIIVILGSEYGGLNSDIYKYTNFNAIIPPNLNINDVHKGSFRLIDSLNVGVSAGIIIHNIKQRVV